MYWKPTADAALNPAEQQMSAPPPHYHGHRKRLRERFVENDSGPKRFVCQAANCSTTSWPSAPVAKGGVT